MNITTESTGPLTVLLKIEIVPADYSAAIETQIAEYKRKAKIPGFRPGHIPTGLIKKMYGKAILADEVNKLISDSLMNYIRDEKIDILGNPLPNPDKNSAIDFENQESFEFYFDLGLTPEFTIPIDQDLEISDYSIKVDDVMVDKYILETRKRYGKHENAAVADELEETTSEAVEPVTELADMNADFYHHVYPTLSLETEEDFREQVRKDASLSFAGETDKLLFSNITDALVKNTEMPLPDEFLKRWLLENNEGKYTPEEIEKNYTSFAESMKWQLIENKLIRENNLAVTDEEIRTYIKINMLRQINVADMDPVMQEQYEKFVDSLMKNKEQVQKINDLLYNAKMIGFFKSAMTFHSKEITYDDYITLVSANHDHEHTHDHEHDHDHGHVHDHDHDHDHDHGHQH